MAGQRAIKKLNGLLKKIYWCPVKILRCFRNFIFPDSRCEGSINASIVGVKLQNRV